MPADLVQARYGDLLARGWLGGYRMVSTGRTARTLLPVALPAGAYANSLALVESPDLPLLLAAFASLPLDYVARAKSGGHNLSLFKVEQLPVPGPACYQAVWPGTGGLTVRRLGPAAGWPTPWAGAPGWRRWPASSGWTTSRPSRRGRPGRSPWPTWTPCTPTCWAGRRPTSSTCWARFGALRAAEEARTGRFVTRERVLAAFERLTPPASG